MKLQEFLNTPKGMSFDKYEKLIAEKHKLENQIRNASCVIHNEDDSLDVLSGEVGSERYNRHLANKKKAERKVSNAKKRLLEIDTQLDV